MNPADWVSCASCGYRTTKKQGELCSYCTKTPVPVAGVTVSTAPSQDLHKDDGKERVDLIPGVALLAIGKIFGFGARKYRNDGWRAGMEWRRLYGSIIRHLAKWEAGQDLDDESGEPHLAHAATDLCMLLEYSIRGLGTDDRWKK